MEFDRRRELRNPHQPTQGTHQHWIIWKKSDEQDVHEPVTVPGMTDMQSQDNQEMADSRLNFLRTRA